MTLNDLCKHAHDAAMGKGWYERERELPELLMLAVSELSEALEADRNEKWTRYLAHGIQSGLGDCSVESFKMFFKDTVEDELADTFIRLADICGYYGIDIDSHIRAKMAYNETRPKKHGKEY